MTQPIALPQVNGSTDDIARVTRANVQNDEDGAGQPYGPASSLKRRDADNMSARDQQTVVVVDRNLLFRAGLIHALDRSRFRVVAECSSIDEAPFRSLTVDHRILLLIGVEGTRFGSIQSALRDLRRKYDNLYIIIFYDHDHSGALLPEMGEIGKLADAFLAKDGIGSESVLKALDLVLLGTSVISTEVLRRMAAEGGNGALQDALVAKDPNAAAKLERIQVSPRSAQEHSGDTLTVREKLILSHLMKGASNKAIAREVGITESTVKIHVRNLMLKIDAKNRTQAAMWGYKRLP
jgi:two-component system nitrate/nitrite response regulator NarL